MAKCLVTGGSGFIGSHLAERLVAAGDDVHVIDDLSAGRLEFTPKGCASVLYSDVGDPTVLRYIAQSGFDVVYHLAAKPRVSFSVDNPAASNDENVGKTVRLLEACRGRVGRFVLASSSAVYGDAPAPTKESQPRDPRSPYALQKMACEDYCGMFSDLYGMDTVCVRPFNVYGPRQLADGAYGTAVSSWLHAIKHGLELRSDGDGSQTRDMVHVTDVVDVFARAAAFKGRFRGEAFNAGAGVAVSNMQILRHLASKHPAVQSAVRHAPARPGDVKATCADITAARAVLGYAPSVDFWAGLEETRLWAAASQAF